jgi:hypothetical protein
MTRKELLAHFKYLLDHCEDFEVGLTLITKVPSPNVDLRVTFRNVGKRHNPSQSLPAAR